MARDLRQFRSLNQYPDRCYYYASDSVSKGKLIPDAQPLGRFNKRDLIPFQWERVTIGGVATNATQFSGTIETMDEVGDIRPDMFVVDQTGMLFRVGTPVVSDDANKSKRVNMRPTIITRMVLIGIE